ncbi:C40 family peptidase [Phreatobacter sp. AB_2022a]|uniref:C40 family peptidase n=1 Tax=Phreatobacter sp. AB_2022a TaxID=3003134 RepID=UPI0022875784|nr:NlpC/P60 family protein [Phreatobacter sp. AB_2022a]MCZ0735912.1 NlpC/P60 family protein [Phreatobacter sp. AB_2022a]
MTAFDRRLTPARPDLAAASLKGRVEAARFVEGRPARVVAPIVPLRGAPRADAMLDTELTYGEPVTIYDETGGWAYLQSARDGYVGYAPAEAFGTPAAATHRVAVLRTYLYPGPGIKLPPIGLIPMNAGLTVTGLAGDFAVTDTGAHVVARHIRAIGEHAEDFVAVAEAYRGTPYLWGGRTSLGLDCSGLVQTALEAAGIAAPRDTDMQERALGTAVPLGAELSGLRRGDLMFWKGHVGIMTSPLRLLHANGHHMMVAEEDVAEAVARIAAKSFGAVTSVRRLGG